MAGPRIEVRGTLCVFAFAPNAENILIPQRLARTTACSAFRTI